MVVLAGAAVAIGIAGASAGVEKLAETINVSPLNTKPTQTRAAYVANSVLRVSGTVVQTLGGERKAFDAFHCYEGCGTSTEQSLLQMSAENYASQGFSELSVWINGQTPAYAKDHVYEVTLRLGNEGKLRFQVGAMAGTQYSGSYSVQIGGPSPPKKRKPLCRKPAARVTRTAEKMRFVGYEIAGDKIVSSTFGKGSYKSEIRCTVVGTITHRDYDRKTGKLVAEVIMSFETGGGSGGGSNSISRAALAYVWDEIVTVTDSEQVSGKCSIGTRGKIEVSESRGAAKKNTGSVRLEICGHKHVYLKAAVDLSVGVD